MARSVFMKKTNIAVMAANTSCRTIKLSVRLGNDDISERTVRVTAEIMDAQQRLITACCKRAYLVGMGSAETELAVFLAQPKLWNERNEPYMYHAKFTIQEHEKELDCCEQIFHVQG